ncbi:MAG: PDZ domain-containing protein [Actinobacteria bacterium]|nr:PDZ domain-containing protein [Actinomycetota bacterium]
MRIRVPITPLVNKIHTPSKVILLALFVAAFLAPLPYVLIAPSTPDDVLGKLITIENVPTFQDRAKDKNLKSRLFITSVLVTNPNSYVSGGEILLNWISGDTAVLPHDSIFPPQKTEAEVTAENTADMKNSQHDATAASLNYLGYNLKSVVEITDVKSESDAFKKLQKGDQIIAVDGIAITKTTDIRDVLKNKKVGDLAAIKIARDNLTLQIKLMANSADAPVVGIFVTNSYDFPISIKFNLERTGGPSGGLIFSLGIIEKLTPEDLIHGRKIAGTGTIDAAGNVGPIGGINEKLIGAAKAGATIFLAPAANCVDLTHIPKGLLVIPVETLKAAVSALKSENPATISGCK